MPFPPPVLDDRRFADLLEELSRRIPVYAPEWTDPSPADPGMTLLDLMAFLGESVLHRFNQIPDATRLWLLRLLAVPLHPAHPATGLIVCTPRTGAVVLPFPFLVKAGETRFETNEDVTALPVTAIVAAKIAAEAPLDGDDDVLSRADAALDAVEAPEDAKRLYYTTEVLGAAPLDVPNAVDHALWLALVAVDEKARDTLLAKDSVLSGAVLNVGVVLTPDVPSLVSQASGEPAGQITWVVSTPDDSPRYRALDIVADGTRGLRQDGVVRLRLPDVTELGLVEPPPDGAGTGDFPPPLEGDPPVVCWLRGTPVSGGPDIPALRWAGVNAATIVQAVTTAPEFLGTGTGQPGQTYPFAHRPVQDAELTVVVEVEEPGGWTPWVRVDSFAASARDDRHWTLDAEAGTATFGDTVRGRAPQQNERIRVLRYRFGGGAEGNVPAGAIDKHESNEQVDVTNPQPTAGGAPAETLADGLERIPGEFRRHDRAVTRSDFAELALATPGREVGRAECLPLFHPRTRATDAAGVVTVVVWPRHDQAHPDAPRPERGLLRRVCAHLDSRRLITTELYVVPPEYRKVAVSVAVRAKPGYSADAVRRWVELVIRQYLAPLPPFGPEGRGWPLGRRVHSPELQAAALQVEGVEYIASLGVAELAEDGSWVARTVLLEPWEVVELAAIVVVVGDAAPPFGTLPPGPDLDGTPVPVPVPKKVC
ncbi:putative baseplate assembly protein [Lentzea sp. BCCO 10_0856]|uniref:Baseplate assembly protein n=1 Tax=Lentzea miocenica TaxID=3095431 RepID=A0ABU4SZR2_9PSEU|nr:putative baseplate assembly protein [Lentzea sp. BCCO 10_0856]MDX8031394.1 putative baseplate assembly protein [Lentzea sp. BCCO 10_0856]